MSEMYFFVIQYSSRDQRGGRAAVPAMMGNIVKPLPVDRTFNSKCPICHVKPKVYGLHKTGGCDWVKSEIICGYCRQFIRYSAIDKHRATECPCYCQYCGITAENEVIVTQHKKKCPKYPLPSALGGPDTLPDICQSDDHRKVRLRMICDDLLPKSCVEGLDLMLNSVLSY